MGLLDQLWDDTVAGPTPDNGLGKLRKYKTFSFRSNSGKNSDGGNVKSYGHEESEEAATRVTRSIMIVKPPGYQSGSTPPVSPAGSTPPVSQFPGSRGTPFRFRRRSASDAYEKEGVVAVVGSPVGSRSSSSPYDV